MLFNQHAQNTPLNLVYTVALFMAGERGNRYAESPDQMSGAPADLSFSDGEMKSELKESKVNPNNTALEGLSLSTGRRFLIDSQQKQTTAWETIWGGPVDGNVTRGPLPATSWS